VAANGDFTHTWFRTKNRSINGSGCFPSGHTAAAFAVATVFAERYQRHRWVSEPLSDWPDWQGFRVLLRAPTLLSDVSWGAALGSSISRFVVLPRSGATQPDL
jgi:membrane-associated phospholipid phosphatase